MLTENLKKIFVGISLLLVVSIGLFLYVEHRSLTTSDGTPVRARIGTLSFSEKDVQYKLALEKAYGNSSLTEDIALQILVSDATEQEVARANNVLPKESDITAFSNNVNSTTKAPEILATIKNIFGTDTASYNRIYLLPKVTNTMLHTFFASSTALHQGEDAKIQQAYKEIQSGKSFEDVAKELGLKYEKSTFPPTEPWMPEGISGATFPENFPIPSVPEVIKNLKPNVSSTPVLEGEQAFTIIRLLSITGPRYNLEIISSLKRNYDEWYKEEVKKIPVKMFSINKSANIK